MHHSQIALLVCVLWCVGCGGTPAPVPPAPLNLTLEEQKIVDLGHDFVKKGGMDWDTVIEVKGPPNRVNVPDWKAYVEEENNIWKVVYHTPKDEMRALGARMLYVNERTREVIRNERK